MQVQPKNLLALLIGSGQFSFADGATTAVAAQSAGMRDFGNVIVFSLQSKGQVKEHIGSYNGIRKVDKTMVTETRVGYQLQLDEIGAQNMRYHLYGTPGAKTTQSVQAAVAADALTTPVSGMWYDLLVAGVRIRKLTTVAIVSTPTVVENTDYVIDYDNGRIRFITAVPGTLTSITLTAPAILSTAASSFTQITPNNNPIRRGMGRIICYDTDGNEFFRHEDFYCEIYPSGNPSFDGTKNTDLTLEVNILDPAGTFSAAQP